MLNSTTTVENLSLVISQLNQSINDLKAEISSLNNTIEDYINLNSLYNSYRNYGFIKYTN